MLTNIKAVSKGYPFYGRCELASGRPLAEVLLPGRTVVAPVLLERMGLRVGDPLAIGLAIVTIADVVLAEPGQPIDALAFGPRVFVSTADLDRIALDAGRKSYTSRGIDQSCRSSAAGPTGRDPDHRRRSNSGTRRDVSDRSVGSQAFLRQLYLFP
ncbi:MAG: hypothetical protein U5R30_18295 [Deltaproteobacteria bacterium]|nr:hypothetical protein [Deltaproteobacteria bacterium]